MVKETKPDVSTMVRWFTALQHDGVTIVEVMVAIAVLGLTVSTLTIGLVAADRMRGRRTIASYGSMLAENEAERIKAEAALSDSIADSTYDAFIHNRAFTVYRTSVARRERSSDLAPSLQEISIVVRRRNGADAIVCVRLLQGFLQAK